MNVKYTIQDISPLKQWLYHSLVVLCIGCGTPQAAAAETSSVTPAAKPNIVVIMADDLGWSDIGAYGGEIATPNLDQLANNGIRFTQFHNTGKCSTSRASFLTGLYAQQVDMGRLLTSSIKNGVTVAEVLRDAGYRTLAVGKHHGKDNLYDRGFDHYWGLRDGATNHFNPGEQRQGEAEPAFKLKPRVWCFDERCFSPYTPENKNYYSSDTFTDWSIELLSRYREQDRRDNKPFFLYLSYQAPHDPLQAWQRDIEKYRGKYRQGFDAIAQARYQRQLDMGLIDTTYPRSKPLYRDWQTLSEEQKDDLDLRMAVYAAMVDNMDQNIGRLVKTLKAMGALDNTLILFMSDNGGNPMIVDSGEGEIGNIDRWASLGGDWANVTNTPLRLFKEDSFQGGISTPLIAHWPAGIKHPGSVSEFVGHFIDFMPTFLELSGAQYPENHRGEKIFPYAGESFLPALQANRNTETSQHLHAPARETKLYWQWALGRAVREGQWKLVESGRFEVAGHGQWQLYDMSRDKTETVNLADRHPDQVARLSKSYADWWNDLPESKDGTFKDRVAAALLWLASQFQSTEP